LIKEQEDREDNIKNIEDKIKGIKDERVRRIKGKMEMDYMERDCKA